MIVNCAGRTRSIIGAQSLINSGLPNPVRALRNGTIGWTLAGRRLEQHATATASVTPVDAEHLASARAGARAIADQAGVGHTCVTELAALSAPGRTTYCFDVRTAAEYITGHLPGFAHAPGGQLVQETDHYAPVRAARIVVADDDGVRAVMTASWLAQMGWDTWAVTARPEDLTAQGPDAGSVHRVASAERYRRPYEGTDNALEAMQAYLDWEYGLVGQLTRDGTHNFRVV